MYQEINDLGFNELTVEQEDVCFECAKKWDCPLVCALNSEVIEFVEGGSYVHFCEMFVAEDVFKINTVKEEDGELVIYSLLKKVGKKLSDLFHIFLRE